MKRGLRALVRWTHVWLGLIGGLVICLMGFTGGLVALRPPLASLLSPAAPPVASCVASPDWDRAAKAASAITGTELNRVYGPVGSDTRYRFRMATEDPILFKHVIYDACSDRILGTINFSWMDWTVDLHHNLLSGKTGRRATGWMGLVMLISSLSGLGLWLLSRPNLRTAFLITPRLSARTPRELHRAIGILAAILLTVEAFTGLWLAFPQTMRGMLAVVVPIPTEARPPRPPKNGTPGEPAGLTAWVTAARAALPDGSIREIRLPEGGGPVQVRMWRPGDFRELGNNVVTVSGSTGKVLNVDLYGGKAAGTKIVQGMASLHYDEWGGLAFRIIAGLSGLMTPVLFVSGFLLWWLPKRRRVPAAKSARPAAEPVPVA